MSEMNSLTDGSVFETASNAELAQWLRNDVDEKLSQRPGTNNMQAAIRQAAKRLDALAAHDAKVRADTLEEVAKGLDEREKKYLKTAERLAEERSFEDSTRYYHYAAGHRSDAIFVRTLAAPTEGTN